MSAPGAALRPSRKSWALETGFTPQMDDASRLPPVPFFEPVARARRRKGITPLNTVAVSGNTAGRDRNLPGPQPLVLWSRNEKYSVYKGGRRSLFQLVFSEPVRPEQQGVNRRQEQEQGNNPIHMQTIPDRRESRIERQARKITKKVLHTERIAQ